MKFPRGTSQAQMAAAAANIPKIKSDMKAAAARGNVKQAVMPGRGMPALAPKPMPPRPMPPKPNLPIRGVGTNDGGPKPVVNPNATITPRVITDPPMPTPMVGAGPMPMKKGGSVGSASKRADGIATKGKTRGKMC
jgi:hypothetical protein